MTNDETMPRRAIVTFDGANYFFWTNLHESVEETQIMYYSVSNGWAVSKDRPRVPYYAIPTGEHVDTQVGRDLYYIVKPWEYLTPEEQERFRVSLSERPTPVWPYEPVETKKE